MLDPLILKLVSIGFGLLFLLSAVHKLTELDRFRTTLSAYEILPAALVVPASIVVPMIEAGFGAIWLGGSVHTSAAIGTACLLGGYTFAIAINLMRGRVHIDCGCSMSGMAGKEQQLSWGLVLRNSILIAIALAAMLPVVERPIGIFDYVTLLAGLCTIVFLYAAANQLFSNGAAIGAWRKRHD